MIKKYKHLLFDLDGTITDSFEAITRSCVYALDHFGIKVEDRKTLLPFIGPPLRESFSSIYGFSDEQSAEAVRLYRERYNVHYLKEHTLYDGIVELLSDLKNAGFELYLATAKPIALAEPLIRHFELEKYFTFLGGASMDKNRDNKCKVLEYVFKECSIDKDTAVMIGDRYHDMEGAEYMGIDALGVSYGFGTVDELAPYNPVFIADTPREIFDFLTK